MIVKILSSAAIILGFYIIAAFLLLPPSKYGSFNFGPEPSYHIGCYDLDSPLNHSYVLRQKMTNLEQSFQLQTKLHPDLTQDSKSMRPSFERDIKEVARDFEKYLNEYNHQKIKNQHDLHYYSSVANARKEFNECRRQNLQKFNPVDCLRAWQKYINGTEQFSDLKDKLKQKINQKQQHQKRIQAYLSGYQQDDQQLEIRFDEKMKQLNKNQVEYENKVMNAKARQIKVNGRLSVIIVDLDSLRQLLQDCLNNANIIKFCEGVNKVVGKIKPSITQQKMRDSLARKRKIIQAQLQSLRKAKKMGDTKQVQASDIELNQTLQQVRILEQQIAQFNTYEEDLCSRQCSPEKIQELRNNITALDNERHQLSEESVQIRQDLITFQNQIGNIGRNKKAAEEEFQNARLIGGYTGCQDEQCEKEQNKIVVTHRTDLSRLANQIIDLQDRFNQKNNDNVGNMNEMSQYIRGVNEIQDCLIKKDIYEQLAQSAPKKTDAGEKKILYAKHVLVKELRDFEL